MLFAVHPHHALLSLVFTLKKWNTTDSGSSDIREAASAASEYCRYSRGFFMVIATLNTRYCVCLTSTPLGCKADTRGIFEALVCEPVIVKQTFANAFVMTDYSVIFWRSMR